MLLAVQLINEGDMAALRDAARPFTTGATPFFSPRQADAYVQLMYAMSQQELLLSVLLAVPFAAVARRLFRRTGANLAEVGVMTLYAFADACLLYLPLILLIRFYGNSPAASKLLRGWGTLAVYTIALVHAARGFFGRTTGVVVRTLVALGITVVIFSILDTLVPVLYVKLAVAR